MLPLGETPSTGIVSPLRSPRGCQSSPGEKGSFHQGDNTMGQRHSLSLPSERVPAAEAAFGSWIYRDLKPATPSSRHFTHAHLSTVKLSFPFSLRLGIKKILRLEQTSLPGIPLIHLLLNIVTFNNIKLVLLCQFKIFCEHPLIHSWPCHPHSVAFMLITISCISI